MKITERHLPKELLERASLRGNEWAWRIADIPAVIEAAREADLVNIGGQLQLRLLDGGTCECHWVQVDTYRSVPKTLPWQERVTRTAQVALKDFAQLQHDYDFIAEIQRAFAAHLQPFGQRGDNPADAICFVWYLLGQGDAEK